MKGGKGADEVLGGNILSGGQGNDYLVVIAYAGDLRRDQLKGSGGNDELYGDGRGDRLDGGPDNDVCDGGGRSGSTVNCES